MTSRHTIALAKVRMALRRGQAGNIESAGGWCVFVDNKGHRYFVIDERMNPVSFQTLGWFMNQDLSATNQQAAGTFRAY